MTFDDVTLYSSVEGNSDYDDSSDEDSAVQPHENMQYFNVCLSSVNFAKAMGETSTRPSISDLPIDFLYPPFLFLPSFILSIMYLSIYLFYSSGVLSNKTPYSKCLANRAKSR